MSLAATLRERGFIYQHTGDLVNLLDGPPRVIYHGIDPSADSAHAGNFVVWLLLKHLHAAGHTIIFLVGGGTGMIGDPKPDAERVLLDLATITHNVTSIRQQAEAIFGTQDRIQFVNNFDWLGSTSLLDFLRDIGKHFTVNELMKKEAIAKRLTSEVGISYTEFAYPLLQAFDYLTLYRQHHCTLQIGGSDQWGNVVAGVELVRRLEHAEVHALTVPLVIDKTTGKKFGKSEGNAIWLSAEKTSPYAFYQFWVNTADENVIDYLKLFTFLSLTDIAALAAAQTAAPHERRAQKALAEAVTGIVHGPTVAAQVLRVSEAIFGSGDLRTLVESDQEFIAAHGPVTTCPTGIALLEVLITTGLASSKREARTFIAEQAVRLHGEVVTDDTLCLTPATHGQLVKVQRGKKQVALVRLV
jgi:tyrosyl-tRNA synthetase